MNFAPCPAESGRSCTRISQAARASARSPGSSKLRANFLTLRNPSQYRGGQSQHDHLLTTKRGPQMGVMFSLEGAPRARGRSRRGRHARTSEDQVYLEALAAFLRSDATSAGRCLSRVPKANLAARLLPAARALARAADLVLASQTASGQQVEFDYELSPACLMGMCTGSAAGNPCTTSPCASPGCQHSCHAGRPRLRM